MHVGDKRVRFMMIVCADRAYVYSEELSNRATVSYVDMIVIQ